MSSAPTQKHRHPRKLVWLLCALMLLGARPGAEAAIALQPAETFFTNVADQLLWQQLGLRLAQIQIAPTNHYDSAVHRIFQVTANIYDATTTNEFPSVFRPLFTTNGGAVFLAGFTNDNRASTLNAWLASNPYGTPMVIAARKGFPNFNELSLRTDVLTQRKLQVTRTNTPAVGSWPAATNVMYTLVVSNLLTVEAWNSYSARYPRPLVVTASNWLQVTLTNAAGTQYRNSAAFISTTNLPAYAWSGAWVLPGNINTNSFMLQAFSFHALSNAPYRFSDNSYGGPTNAFEVTPGFPVPQSVLCTSNRLTFRATDGDNIIDFVILDTVADIDLHRDLWAGQPYGTIYNISAPIANSWNTNRASALARTEGMRDQLEISLGSTPISQLEWISFGLNFANATGLSNAMNQFRMFCGYAPFAGGPLLTNNPGSMLTPFNPAARLSMFTTWQVNDPLVHYTVNDLVFTPLPTNVIYLKPTQPPTPIWLSGPGFVNDVYSPWGGTPGTAWTYHPFAFAREVKDAGVYQPDLWNFPTNESFAPRWLGRVHRGTPWQTIHLQTDANPYLWSYDAGRDSRTHPANDLRMAALLAALMNTNDVRTLTSINTTNPNTWDATLTGLTVLSNSVANPMFYSSPQFDSLVIASNSPQVSVIVAAINRTRAAQRGQFLPDVAAFLSVPELSSASPWLNLSTEDQWRYGLTDEACEALPSQLLSLIRTDPVGTVTRLGNSIEVRFTAFDGYAFRVEASADLATWTTVSEPHYSTNGVFTLTLPASPSPQFFRAVLPPVH